MRYALVIVCVAGCGGGMKHHASRNAPGIVDIDAPIARETGDPQFYEVPADPGEHAVGLAPGLGVGMGVGRLSNDFTVELSVQMHISYGERESSLGRGAVGYPWSNWGATIGWGVFQVTEDDDPDTYMGDDYSLGPIYAELTRQWFLLSASAGLAIYPTPGLVAGGRAEGVDAGAQISFMAEPLGLRFRYMADSGFEAYFGYQFEIPTSITWSK